MQQERRFQSTLPMRGGTKAWLDAEVEKIFQSTLPMRGGTAGLTELPCIVAISIHPPHAGRDDLTSPFRRPQYHFNPPSPCGEGQRLSGRFPRRVHFNPPPPCGEGLDSRVHLRPGGIFQSTLPMRGGTKPFAYQSKGQTISIHPPHAGRDLWGRLV